MRWSEILQNPEILYNFKSEHMLALNCDYCNNEMHQMVKYLRKHVKEGYSNKFCSKECSSKFKTKREFNCIQCNTELKSGQYKFCSRSCSVSYNNKFTKTKEKTKTICLNCNQDITNCVGKKYCSHKCQKQYENKINIQNWLDGKDPGYKGKAAHLKSFIRKYLFETRGTACSICGWDERHPEDGSILTEIDHIDGDAKNNHPNNLRILCPNHHAMTSNFRSRNKNSSRVRK